MCADNNNKVEVSSHDIDDIKQNLEALKNQMHDEHKNLMGEIRKSSKITGSSVGLTFMLSGVILLFQQESFPGSLLWLLFIVSGLLIFVVSLLEGCKKRKLLHRQKTQR